MCKPDRCISHPEVRVAGAGLVCVPLEVQTAILLGRPFIPMAQNSSPYPAIKTAFQPTVSSGEGGGEGAEEAWACSFQGTS